MTIPVSMIGTRAITSADGSMTDVGPYVKGHRRIREGGRVFSRVAATRIPGGWPVAVLAAWVR
jgi:hypothetical protein